MQDDDDPQNLEWAKASLVLGLRQKGITQRLVVDAFERVPHELFVPDEYANYAYKDCALPIECGQSMTSPVKVAQMLSKLKFDEQVPKILEIGTGSGYATALLSRFAKRVFFRLKNTEHCCAWRKIDGNNSSSQILSACMMMAGWVATPGAIFAHPFDRVSARSHPKPVGAAGRWWHIASASRCTKRAAIPHAL